MNYRALVLEQKISLRNVPKGELANRTWVHSQLSRQMRRYIHPFEGCSFVCIKPLILISYLAPTGKCTITLTAADLGNFVVHKILEVPISTVYKALESRLIYLRRAVVAATSLKCLGRESVMACSFTHNSTLITHN